MKTQKSQKTSRSVDLDLLLAFTVVVLAILLIAGAHYLKNSKLPQPRDPVYELQLRD